MSPAEFFRALYGESAPGFRALFCAPSLATTWLPALDIEGAAREVEKLSQAEDVYFGVGLQREALGPTRRGKAADVIAIPGLWADIDFADAAAHKETALPPDASAAAALAASFPLRPTLLIHSGHGLQAWWLFKGPWVFESDALWSNAASLVERFQAVLRRHAENAGWKLDTTADLARVLRPPGSWNRKVDGDPKPVRVMKADLSRRYDPAEFEPHLENESVKSGAAKPATEGPPVGSATSFDDAVLRYNSDHHREWPNSRAACPACADGRSFGRLADKPDRWACFSTNHQAPGLQGRGCHHGDALDLDAHAAGRTREAHLRAEGYLTTDRVVGGSKPPIRQLRVVPFREVSPDFKTPQLIKGWLDLRTVNVLFGASNAGKSFFSLYLGVHVAMGWTWFGRRVRRGGVVYVAAESPTSIERRVQAMRQHYRLAGKDVPLWVVPEAVNLVRSDRDLSVLVSTIAGINHGISISLVIVDTLAASMAGGDENSFETMGVLVSRLLELRNQTGAAVLVVHHAGKDEARGARGHSSLKAAADVEIELRREEDRCVAEITKCRDGENGLRVGFELQPIVVATDADGEPVKVPIVVPLTPDQVRQPPKGRKGEVLAVLARLMEAAPGGVKVDDWKTEFVKVATAPGKMKESSAMDTFGRALRELMPTWVVVGDGVARLAPSRHQADTRGPAAAGDSDNADKRSTTDRRRSGRFDRPDRRRAPRKEARQPADNPRSAPTRGSDNADNEPTTDNCRQGNPEPTTPTHTSRCVGLSAEPRDHQGVLRDLAPEAPPTCPPTEAGAGSAPAHPSDAVRRIVVRRSGVL